MSWFQSANIASLAKSALKEAQKTIDKALDIKDDESTTTGSVQPETDLLASWGLRKSSSSTTMPKSESKDNLENGWILESKSLTTVPTLATKKYEDLTTEQVIKAKRSSPASASKKNLRTSKREREDFPLESSASPTKTSISITPQQNLSSSSTSTSVLESGDSSKFQSLWLLTDSDSYESSIEISSASKREPSASTSSSWTESNSKSSSTSEFVKVPDVTLSEISLSDGDDLTLTPAPSIIETEAEDPDPVLPEQEYPTINLSNDIEAIVQPQLQVLDDGVGDGDVTENENLQIQDDEDGLRISAGQGQDALDGQCHVRNTLLDIDGDEKFVGSQPCPPPEGNSTLVETLEVNDTEPPKSEPEESKSRATSSISVISEEKDSRSSSPMEEGPSVSPTGTGYHCHHGHTGFEALHQSRHPAVPHTSQDAHSGAGIMTTAALLHQSLSLNSTPQSHSRSNSNTSCSFERIDDHRTNRHLNFVSSSSSDIEVIPLDSISSIAIATAEVETQTEDNNAMTSSVAAAVPVKVAQLLQEKEMETKQLREEGEKLSKKQFDLMNIIKKLRAKEKEMEANAKGLKNELSLSKTEVERLTKSRMNMETLEQGQSEVINKLNMEKRRLEGVLDEVNSKLEDEMENAAKMKASLEEAGIEIIQLENTLLTYQEDSKEMNKLKQDNSYLSNQNSSLEKELSHLRSVLNETQTSSSTKEVGLQKQLNEAQYKIHHLELELTNVSSDIADATSPLSLQIEKLQNEIPSNQIRYEKKLSELQRSLDSMEVKLKMCVEGERVAKLERDLARESTMKLESQLEQLSAENSRTLQKLDSEIEEKERALQKLSDFEKLNLDFEKVDADLQMAVESIESLRVELKNSEAAREIERKKFQHLQEQFTRNPVPKSGENSPTSVISEASYLSDVFDPHQNHAAKYYDLSSNLYENLQQQLRKCEQELQQCQSEVSKSERIRKTLNDEIGNLTIENEELLVKLGRLEVLEADLRKMEGNYNAVLQMYGEKVEEADELRLDLQDVKEMYKIQIDQLLKKS